MWRRKASHLVLHRQLSKDLFQVSYHVITRYISDYGYYGTYQARISWIIFQNVIAFREKPISSGNCVSNCEQINLFYIRLFYLRVQVKVNFVPSFYTKRSYEVESQRKYASAVNRVAHELQDE